MTPDTLLAELQTRGIKVRRDGNRLLVLDPARSLTPGLSAAIDSDLRADSRCTNMAASRRRLDRAAHGPPAAPEGTTPDQD